MNNNTMKILGAAMWAFIFNCTHGMNSEKFSWQGCTKHYHECLFQGDKYGTNSQQYKKALEELSAYLENDPYSDAQKYEKEVKRSIERSSTYDSLKEVYRLIENATVSINLRIKEHKKKECLEFVNKIFVLQRIKAKFESQIEEQSIQGYKNQIDQEISSKKPAEALSWIRQREEKIKQELEEIQYSSLSDEEQTREFELKNELSALSKVSDSIIKTINEQTKEAYKDEVNKAISNMSHDEASSWLEKQWDNLAKQLKKIEKIEAAKRIDRIRRVLVPVRRISDDDREKYRELICKQEVLRVIMQNYQSNS